MARDKFSLTRLVHLMHPRVYVAIWKVIGQSVCWSHWKWDNSSASGVSREQLNDCLFFPKGCPLIWLDSHRLK